MKRVGFVIRTKNEMAYLGRVLESISNQTYTDWVITVVDSGSTDGTTDLVRSFPGVNLYEISPESFGYSYALNLGIQKTQAEYICIISGHSIPISKRWLEYGVGCLDQDTNLAGITGHYVALPDAPWSVQVWDFWSSLTWRSRRRWQGMTNTNALIRKSMWEMYPFDESLSECEDYDWALEMLARGYDIALEPRFSVRHSHFHLVGAETFAQRKARWDQITPMIRQRQRPRN